MKRMAFLFSGEGSQYVGMGMDIAAKYPEAAAIFAVADKILNFALRDVMWDGPAEHLSFPEIAQPATLAVCVALIEVLKQRGLCPAVTGGIGIGEYAALVAANCIGFPQAIELAKIRGELFHEEDAPSLSSANRAHFQSRLIEANLQSTKIPVVSSVFANNYTVEDPIVLPLRQTQEEFCFKTSLQRLFNDGYGPFIEIGPSRTISTMLNSMGCQTEVYSVSTVHEVDRLLQRLS